MTGGKTHWRILTLTRSQAPEVQLDGDRVRVGGWKVAFDGKKIVLE